MPKKEKLKEIYNKLSTPEERFLDFVDNYNKEDWKGEDGKDGEDGTNGSDGLDGKDGRDGKEGENGRDGIDGKDGILITPEEVRDKLKELEDEKRLSVFDLKDTEFLRGKDKMMTGWYPSLKVVTDNTLTGMANVPP